MVIVVDVTESLFKKLATPLCKNKEKKPKKYSESYYKPFIRYLEKHSYDKNINNNNFDIFFIEFCSFHFEDDEGFRLDFSDKIKLDLLKRSGGCCAVCGVLTISPLQGNNNEALNIGEACHIRPASAYGPRSDIKYRDENLSEIVSIENGIWACLNCHKEIDKDVNRYTVEYLKKIKSEHESIMLKAKNEKISIKNLIENFLLSKDPDLIYVNRKIYEEKDSKMLSLMDVFLELKYLEKISIDNISIFKILENLKNKKIKMSKKGIMSIRIEDDNLSFDYEMYTEEDEGSAELRIRKEMEANYDEYTVDKLLVGEEQIKKNKFKDLAHRLSNYDEIIEFFVMDWDNEKMFKLKKKDGYSIIEHENNHIRFSIIDGDKYIDIDHREDRRSWKLKDDSKDAFLNYFDYLNFVDYLDGFGFNSCTVVIRYMKSFYELPLFIIYN